VWGYTGIHWYSMHKSRGKLWAALCTGSGKTTCFTLGMLSRVDPTQQVGWGWPRSLPPCSASTQAVAPVGAVVVVVSVGAVVVYGRVPAPLKLCTPSTWKMLPAELKIERNVRRPTLPSGVAGAVHLPHARAGHTERDGDGEDGQVRGHQHRVHGGRALDGRVPPREDRGPGTEVLENKPSRPTLCSDEPSPHVICKYGQSHGRYVMRAWGVSDVG